MDKEFSLYKGFKDDSLEVVRISFSEPASYCVLSVQELLLLLELWIIGEEKKYPQSKGFQGRWLLFKEIKRVFDETEVK